MNEGVYWLAWKFVCIIMFISAITLAGIYTFNSGGFYFLQSMNWVVFVSMGALLIWLSSIRSRIKPTQPKPSRRMK